MIKRLFLEKFPENVYTTFKNIEISRQIAWKNAIFNRILETANQFYKTKCTLVKMFRIKCKKICQRIVGNCSLKFE